MKKIVSVLVCLCVLFSAMSILGVSAEEKNLVVNPGFEEDLNLDKVNSPWDRSLTWTNGDFSLCKIEATTEEAHSGQKSMKVSDRTQWYASGYQIHYNFTKGETITFSAWVKLAKGAGQRVMGIDIMDKNLKEIIVNAGGVPPHVVAVDYEWRKIEGTYTPSVDLKDAVIGVLYWPQDENDPDQINWSGDFYVDDVYVSSASGYTTVGGGAATTTTKKAETTTEQVADATTTTVEATTTTAVEADATTTDVADVTTTTVAADADKDEQNTTTAPAATDAVKDDAGSLAWLWIVLGAVVVIGAGIAVYFLVIKKSGK